METTKDKMVLIISIDKEGSEYKASGNMTSGLVKMMIGELEVIKSHLIYDLEKSSDDGYAEQ